MFSNNFMRYLINYQPDGFEYNEKSEQTTREIKFNDRNHGTPLKVFVTLDKK